MSNESEMKQYLVGTFCDKGETRRTQVRTYLDMYNPLWDDCVEFEVEAINSKVAKKIAVEQRLNLEAMNQRSEK